MPTQPLYEQLSQQFHQDKIEESIKNWTGSKPAFVAGLNPLFPLRAYQQQAIARFDYAFDVSAFHAEGKRHFLFNMATGSGKTLLMASQILYQYARGYRVFLFFVNSDAVLRKTKENFLDTSSRKCQFASSVSFNGRQVEIREIDSPEDVAPDAINILFSTIQGLHVRLKTPRENSVTFDALAEHKIVLLADEAHHLNAGSSGNLQEEAATWQETVEKLLGSRQDNVLLEYTATVDWNDNDIRAKYEPRCLMRYDLSSFREDLYSKDVYLSLSQADRNTRLLSACLVSYYRSRVAESHGIPLKPLVLVKSRIIRDSDIDETAFQQMLLDLTPQHVAILRQAAQLGHAREILPRAFRFLDSQGETDAQIASVLPTLYSQTLVVNSQNRAALESGQLASLENPANPVRVIFVVDMLNEGWDVLNLFDIVRLDESDRRDANIKTKDVQLIGRGARYFPFEMAASGDNEARFKRKFDDDLMHDLRALEELHYHSRNTSRFIESLTLALQEAGLQDSNTKTFTYEVKASLKQTAFWQQGELFLNQREVAGKVAASQTWPVSIELTLPANTSSEQNALTGAITRSEQATIKTHKFSLGELGEGILLKALSGNDADFFSHATLKEYFSDVDGPINLIEKRIGAVQVTVSAPETFSLENTASAIKLNLARQALASMEKALRPSMVLYKGSKKFTGYKASKLLEKEVVRQITPAQDKNGVGHSIINEAATSIAVSVNSADWYVFQDNHGTEEEKRLIRLIHDEADKLRAYFDQFVLLRNEKFVTIHAFDDGTAFEPDFILWAKCRGSEEILHAFIEPKGQQLIDWEQWKEKFLLDVEPLAAIVDQAGYRLLGLPFFNADPARKAKFVEAFETKILGTS